MRKEQRNTGDGIQFAYTLIHRQADTSTPTPLFPISFHLPGRVVVKAWKQGLNNARRNVLDDLRNQSTRGERPNLCVSLWSKISFVQLKVDCSIYPVATAHSFLFVHYFAPPPIDAHILFSTSSPSSFSWWVRFSTGVVPLRAQSKKLTRREGKRAPPFLKEEL